jgi:hypothetical protein
MTHSNYPLFTKTVETQISDLHIKYHAYLNIDKVNRFGDLYYIIYY